MASREPVMKKIEKDGIYRIGDGPGADYVQLRAGQEVPEDYHNDATWIEAIPEPGQPLGSKAASEPSNKKAAAPENKSA